MFRSLSNEDLIVAAKRGEALNAMQERLFDFGRFAFFCSSAGDGTPANLQGIWGGEYGPAWAADYYNDINIQMNYSQALPGNMAELSLSYFDYYESMMEDFRTNARNIYGCRGICVPISQTMHGLCYNSICVSWTGAGGWLAQLFYDYWLFTQDRDFLARRAVPFMKEVALFYEDFLFEGKDGKYIFSPSHSPENTPLNQNTGGFVINATMDIAVTKELLSHLITACEELGIEQDGVNRWRRMLDKLPEYMINSDGALREWAHRDLEDNYPHRHLTHLYPVFPGFELTPERGDPELFEACKIAVEMKMRHLRNASPFGGTMFLIAGNYARFEQGDKALETLEINARDHVHPNLLGLMQKSRPIMQFDGTAGIPAIMLEMLVISEPGLIKLLPALPQKWPVGKIEGVLCRGGVEVDIEWDMPQTKMHVSFLSRTQQEVTVKFPGPAASIHSTDLPLSIKASPLGEVYKIIVLPESKQLSMMIELQ